MIGWARMLLAWRRSCRPCSSNQKNYIQILRMTIPYRPYTTTRRSTGWPALPSPAVQAGSHLALSSSLDIRYCTVNTPSLHLHRYASYHPFHDSVAVSDVSGVGKHWSRRAGFFHIMI
jgi:hypothetical protein